MTQYTEPEAMQCSPYLRSCVLKMTRNFADYSFAMRYAGCQKAYD